MIRTTFSFLALCASLFVTSRLIHQTIAAEKLRPGAIHAKSGRIHIRYSLPRDVPGSGDAGSDVPLVAPVQSLDVAEIAEGTHSVRATAAAEPAPNQEPVLDLAPPNQPAALAQPADSALPDLVAPGQVATGNREEGRDARIAPGSAGPGTRTNAGATGG
jgi:hypothetical protein